MHVIWRSVEQYTETAEQKHENEFILIKELFYSATQRCGLCLRAIVFSDLKVNRIFFHIHFAMSTT